MYFPATVFLKQVSRSGLQQALRACEVAAQWPLALHLVNHGQPSCGGYGMAALVSGGVRLNILKVGVASGIDVRIC